MKTKKWSYMKLSKKNLILILIVILGFGLRSFNVGVNAMYGDELTIVYDSYSILKTGHDQTGVFLPLTFPMGAGRPGGYVYFSIPFVALFGPSELGVRTLSLLSGVGLILVIYFLCRKLLGNWETDYKEIVPLVAAFLIAVNPWSLSMSRGGFEANFALLLASLGTVAFLYAHKKPANFIVSAICFGLVLHTYPTYKLTLPLFLVLLLFYSNQIRSAYKSGTKVFSIAGLMIFTLLSLLVATQTFIGGSESRFWDLNIFSKEDVRQLIIQDINNSRDLSALPEQFKTLFYNKLNSYFLLFTQSYFRNFSPDFLFISGDGQPRHNMATTGGFYLFEMLSIALGGLALFQKDKRLLGFLLGWILTIPLATAFLGEVHFLRNAFMIPPLLILSAVGIVFLINIKHRYNLIGLALLVLFLIQFVFILQKTYFLAPNLYSHFWSQPAKHAANYALKNLSKYDYILLSDRIDNIEYALPVYGRINPEIIIGQNKNRVELNGQKFKKVGNIYIGRIPEQDINGYINGLDGSVLLLESINIEDKVIGARPITNYLAQPEFLILVK
jgi:4-amino-4-deoxy-L-arabinose transferase-like glycosyltransferase